MTIVGGCLSRGQAALDSLKCRARAIRARWPGTGALARQEANTGLTLDAAAVLGGPADGLLADGRTVAHFGDIEVLVVRTRRGTFAVENRCPHMGRRLSDAFVCGRSVICAGHHRRYDLASGQPSGRIMCRTPGLRTFDVDVVDGMLWLSPATSV